MMNVELIDFYRPDASRKNLYITNIPQTIPENDIVAKFHEIFKPYGLVYGVQVFPGQVWVRGERSENQTKLSNSTGPGHPAGGGYYAFVTFYSATAANKAKEDLNSVLLLEENECKIAYARRKKDITDKQLLHFTRCYELINYYLGFNSWSTSIKTLFEDKDSVSETEQTKTIKYVCLVELCVTDLNTDGVGVWEETFLKTDPMSKIQAVCKCKKLSQSRAIENAFSKVLLVVLPNGKATVEIDTTKPDFNSANYVPDDQLIKVNELDLEPTSENLPDDFGDVDLSNMSEMDDVNIHILQELEDDF